MPLITIIKAFNEPIEMKDQPEKYMTCTMLESNKSLSWAAKECEIWVFLHRRYVSPAVFVDNFNKQQACA